MFSHEKKCETSAEDSHQAQLLDIKYTWRLLIENMEKHGCVSRWSHIADGSLCAFIYICAYYHDLLSDESFERILFHCVPIDRRSTGTSERNKLLVFMKFEMKGGSGDL